jgi:hypothetical protein
MDDRTFAIELIKALAWPVVGIMLLLVFGPPIRQRIPFLKKLKVEPTSLEAEFEQELRRVDVLSAKLGASVPRIGSHTHVLAYRPTSFRTVDLRARRDPRREILYEWESVQRAVMDAARLHGSPSELASREDAIELLASKKVLPPEAVQLFRELGDLRDKVVDSTAYLSSDVAERYSEAARTLISALEPSSDDTLITAQ